MTYKNWLAFLSLIFAVLLFGARAANACSCGPKLTVLDAYEKADFVIIARVVSVEKSEKAAPEGQMSDGENYVDGVKSTRVRVERVFKGSLKVGEEMTFAHAGQTLEGFDVRVPRVEETITIEGVFLYSDGKPVIDEGVEFKTGKTEDDDEGDSRPTTESVIKKTGRDNADVETPVVEIHAENDLHDVELKYPFPSCKKAK